MHRFVLNPSEPLRQAYPSFTAPTAPEKTFSEGIDKSTFKQIFRDHWEAFKARHPRFDSPDYDTTVQKMLDCGDPEKMGDAQYRCLNCGETRRIAFSCKSSFCLSCAQPRMSQWADFIGRRLFPGVTYRHFILTTPKFLRHWFYLCPDLLSQLMRSGHACLQDIDWGWKNYPKGFVAHLQPGDVPPGGKGLAEYLAKYVVSPPISVRRLEQYDGQRVRYGYEDHKTQAIEHVTLPVLHFIGRMVQQILPKGFQRIRYFGLHSNPCYQQIREQLATVLPTSTPSDPRGYRVLPRPQFAQLFLTTFGQDPLLCPRCATPMDWEYSYHPKHGILKEAQLFQDEPPDGRTESQVSAVAAGDARRDSLATSVALVQLPLPFM